MIRVCFENIQISPIEIGRKNGSILQNRKSYCKTFYADEFASYLQSSEKQLPDDSSVFRK